MNVGTQQVNRRMDFWLGICKANAVEGEGVRRLRLLVREFFRESPMIFGVEGKTIRVNKVKEL